jgi:hypothetical protein
MNSRVGVMKRVLRHQPRQGKAKGMGQVKERSVSVQSF